MYESKYLKKIERREKEEIKLKQNLEAVLNKEGKSSTSIYTEVIHATAVPIHHYKDF